MTVLQQSSDVPVPPSPIGLMRTREVFTNTYLVAGGITPAKYANILCPWPLAQ